MKSLILILFLFSIRAFAVPSTGTVNNGLPSTSADGTTGKVMRLAKYQEQFVIPLTAGLAALADEGTYFSAMTTSPGTGYALGGATQTGWVATTPSVFIKNGASAGGVKIFPDSCHLSITAAGTGITSISAAVILDKGSRTTSAGTALTVGNATGTAAAKSTVSTGVVAGAVTASAATTPVYLYRGGFKNAVPVIGDSYTINFAALDSTGSLGGALSAGPAVIDGGETLLIYTWFPGSSAAASGEWQCSWWER